MSMSNMSVCFIGRQDMLVWKAVGYICGRLLLCDTPVLSRHCVVIARHPDRITPRIAYDWKNNIESCFSSYHKILNA